MKRIGVIVLLLALLLVPFAAAADIPAPSEVFYVLDRAGVLSDETVEDILTKDESLEEQTGAQLCVVTVDFIGSARISDYAYELFNEWGIGDKTKNNGLLLLIVTGAEDYYLLQGTGLEDYLASSTLQNILDEYMEPYFAAGDYDMGVRATMDALFTRLAGYYGITLASPDTQYSGSDAGFEEFTVGEPGVYPTPFTYSSYGLSGVIGWFFSLLRKVAFGVFVIVIVIILAILTSGRRRRRSFWGMTRGYRPPMPPPPGGFRGPGMGPGMGPRPGGPGMRSNMGPRPGSFGGHSGSFGGGHTSGFGSRSGGFSGGGHSSHVGGGGASRGGGAGRH